MAKQQNSILAIGLKYGGPNSPYTPEQLEAMINGEMQKLRSAGWHAQAYLVDNRTGFDLDSFVKQLNETPWTVVCIGYGLRGSPSYTPLFEQVMNLITETVSPVPKFSFSTAPDGVIESMTRVMGEI